MKTTDLMDKYEDELTIAQIGAFRRFGRLREFSGRIVTVKCYEDNTRAKKILESPCDDRVLVVDGGASYGRALMGDNVAAIAISNGWQGVVINGYIRDSADIDQMDIAVIALGATPRRPLKQDHGIDGQPVSFAGVTFMPGHFAYADEDGLVLAQETLSL